MSESGSVCGRGNFGRALAVDLVARTVVVGPKIAVSL